ncbi:hypothetical protein R4Z09_04185 [Niallia oryzisoli]|uniref:Uncharacterized protein n=1 Tax=Niallia oryzisoli TaxID=1737571 RepID=A0ABZ2CGS4_9BACI
MLGILAGLLVAWLLSLIGVHSLIITGLSELFNLNLTIAGYYVLFGLLGFILELISPKRRMRYKRKPRRK